MRRKIRVQVADLAASTLAVEVVPAAPANYAHVVTRFLAVFYAAGAACSAAGANDNLVIRVTDKDGAIQTLPMTGDGFLETAPTAFVAAVVGPAANQALLAGAKLVLAYAASADGITVTSATGYLDVIVEYDTVFVGS